MNRSKTKTPTIDNKSPLVKVKPCTLGSSKTQVALTPVVPTSGSSTPGSSTQRELKKLEDYWTRHNPVQEDSPRLRSNRKTKTDVQENIGHGRKQEKEKQMNSKEVVSDQLIHELPESPIPKQQNTNLENEYNSLIKTEKHETIQNEKTVSGGTSTSKEPTPIPKGCKVNDFTSIKNIETIIMSPLPRRTTRNSPALETYTNIKTLDIQKGNSSIGSNHDSLLKSATISKETQPSSPVDFSFLKSIVNQATESDDDDDDDYMPPRKKLRSELNQDELWEGFPLKVSFKRLAPMAATKSHDEPKQNNEPMKHESVSQNRIYLQSAIQDIHEESNSLDKTLIYEDSDSQNSDKDQKQDSVPQIESHVTNEINVCKCKQDTTITVKALTPLKYQRKRKFSSPSKSVKRSVRLIEKSEHTPNKSENVGNCKSENHKDFLEEAGCKDNIIPSSSIQPLFQSNIELLSKQTEPNKCNSKVKVSNSGILNIEEFVNKNPSPTPGASTDAASNDSTITVSYGSNNLIDKSISQILSCDQNTNLVPDENAIKQNKQEDDKTEHDVILAVSGTIQNIFEKLKDISTEVIQSTSGKSDQCPTYSQMHKDSGQTLVMIPSTSTEESKSDRKTRRSLRLSEIEKALKEKLESKEGSRVTDDDQMIAHVADNKNEGTHTKREVTDDIKANTNSTFSNETINLESKQVCRNIFTSLQNKTKKTHNKLVPPLRIKLKQPDMKLTIKQNSLSSSKSKIVKSKSKAEIVSCDDFTRSPKTKKDIKPKKATAINTLKKDTKTKTKKIVVSTGKKGYTPTKQPKTKLKKASSKKSKWKAWRRNSNYKSQSSLKQHVLVHGEEEFECHVYHKKYFHKDEMNRHMQSHQGNKYLCQTCGNSFSCHWNLIRHIKSVHDKELNFTCGICHKKCSSKASLTAHVGKHVGKNPFECKTCQKGFLYQTNLRRHEGGNSCHNKVMPSSFSCQSCSKAFQTNKSLRQHNLIHKEPENMCQVSMLNTLNNS